MRSDQLEQANAAALAARPCLKPGYRFRPVSTRQRDFHDLKSAHPYFGYIEVRVERVAPFLMFSNNDDRVAQTYFWYGSDAFESMSLRVWRELVGKARTVLDVGAFTGVYALVAAQANRDARILAFEPIRRVFGRLVVNLAVNRLGQRVEAFDVALGEEEDLVSMHLYQGHLTLSSGSSLTPKPNKPVVGREHVDVVPLDRFLERTPVVSLDVAKIDVEMAERQVIAGMRETLGRFRPHLLVEVSTQDNLAAVLELLEPHGYHFAVVDDLDERFAVDDPAALTGVRNVLFSPWNEGRLRAFCGRFDALQDRQKAS